MTVGEVRITVLHIDASISYEEAHDAMYNLPMMCVLFEKDNLWHK